MRWPLDSPARFLHERAKLSELAESASWLIGYKWAVSAEARLQVELDIQIGATQYPLLLIYPDLFPDTPAIVRKRDDTVIIRSEHQYLNGDLCLEWGPDNWHPDVTGADLLRSAYALLLAASTEGTSTEPIPSRHALTLGQEARKSHYRFVATSDFVRRVKSIESAVAKLGVHSVLHANSRIFFCTAIFDGEQIAETSVAGGIAQCSRVFSVPHEAWLFKCVSVIQSQVTPSSDELFSMIRTVSPGFDLLQPASELSAYVVLVLSNTTQMRVFMLDRRDSSVVECAVLSSQTDGSERNPESHSRLIDKRIGVVGLGSVGGKVALSLCRAGIRRFVLVDDDILLPENVVRHALDWSSVGVNKASAVKDALSLIARDVDVDVRSTRISGQESATATAATLDVLASCDLIVDATADSSAFVVLAAIAARRRKVLVWGEVFPDGLGGLIARSRPGLDAGPMEMRSGIHDYLQRLEPAPFANATGYDTSDNSVFSVGTNAEVDQISSLIVRLALDSLLAIGQAVFPYSAYLIGLREGWTFRAPFDTIPISIQNTADERQATSVSGIEADRIEALTIFSDLIDDVPEAKASHSD